MWHRAIHLPDGIIWHRASGIEQFTCRMESSGIWHLVSGIGHLASGIWYLASGQLRHTKSQSGLT